MPLVTPFGDGRLSMTSGIGGAASRLPLRILPIAGLRDGAGKIPRSSISLPESEILTSLRVSLMREERW